MPGEPLMCVWQAVHGWNTSDTGVTLTSLRAVLDQLKNIANIRYSECGVTEVFTHNKIKFADFLDYVDGTLRAPGVPIPLLIKDIEKKCWDIAEYMYKSENLNKQDLFKMWAIFNRLCVSDSYPPIMSKEQTNYLFQKIAQNINSVWGSSDSIPDAGLTFMQMIEDLDRTYFSVTSTMLVRQCIEDIHSWLVREVMKTGMLYKRTRKSANWTSWQKRWFVLSPGRLEYFHHSRREEKKGEVIIDSKSDITSKDDYKAVLKSLGNRFKLSNFPSLEIEMCAETEEDKQEWINALQNNVASMTKGVTPQMELLKQQQQYRKEQCRDSLLKTENELNASERIARSGSLKLKTTEQQNNKSSADEEETVDTTYDTLREYDEELYQVQRDKLKTVFVSIDKDGNGKIDRIEFSAFISGLGPHIDQREASIIFDEIDKGNTQFILFEDFLEYFTKFLLGKSTDTRSESKLRAAFLKADRDGMGVINFSEFCKYAHSVRRSVTIDKLMNAFDKLDAEGKGTLEYREFKDFFKNEPAFVEKHASFRLSQTVEERLKRVYEEADAATLLSYLRERWKKFSSFKRPGVSGDVVMTGPSGIVEDIVPGTYNLLDLACFNDLPPIEPKHIAVPVQWIQSASSDCLGRAVFPNDFNGMIPSEIATGEHLAYYGCTLADGNQLQVSLLYRHGIQDFTYENNYLDEYVTGDKALGALGGAGIERHAFAHLDCPLEDDSGFFVIGKYQDDLLHLTGFKVPTRHTIYVPGGVIHSNDYLKGTWRTMLSDEAEVQLVQLVKIIKEDNRDKVRHFNFSFNQFV